MKNLQPKEVQEGKVFHSKNGEESMRVLEIKTLEVKTTELYFAPCRVVFFQDVKKNTEARGLPIGLFCAQYKRKKR